MRITPVDNKVFGATVTEVALGDLGDAEFAVIKAAFLDFGFLSFPGQFLSDEENVSFGKRFGELEFGANPMSNQEKLGDGRFGRIFGIDTQRMRTNVGNEAWHTDSTYKPISSKCGMLSAVAVPKTGGETELADLRAGYAALDQATRDRIEDFCAYHSTQYSQANDVGDFPPQNSDGIYHGEAYLRPLVKVHPETGVKNLFVGRHAFGIPGLERCESKRLIKSLLDFTVSDPSRVYTHRWRPGDTLFWDNRAILHRAQAYDYAEPRVLIGTRVAGEPESELAYYPSDPEAEAGRRALKAELDLLRRETSDRRYGGTTATPVV
ncbi:MAG: TauD/TfdA family dioxygenase [Gammaproteobacteria bacterium]|nr:TauD/TfdA family dioxygenase [Gammaproteobacteria bacterium]